jgi:hypothetical protein
MLWTNICWILAFYILVQDDIIIKYLFLKFVHSDFVGFISIRSYRFTEYCLEWRSNSKVNIVQPLIAFFERMGYSENELQSFLAVVNAAGFRPATWSSLRGKWKITCHLLVKLYNFQNIKSPSLTNKEMAILVCEVEGGMNERVFNQLK